MLSKLNGSKTYIGLVAGGVLGLLVQFNVVTWDQVDWIATLVGMWTGVAIAHKGNKIAAKG